MNTTYRFPNGASASWSDDEREAFRRGEWRTDCSHIELRARDAASPLTYSGPGFLFQDAEHQLRVKIYAVQVSNAPPAIEQFANTPSGQQIPETDYFDLVALDEGGRQWHSERHLLDQSTHSVGGVPILELPLEELWCQQSVDGLVAGDKAASYGLNFTVFETLAIPRNAPVKTEIHVAERVRSSRSWLGWKFEAAGCDFELIPYPSHLEIRVSSPLG